MGWRQYVRAVEADEAKRNREAARAHRESIREQRRQEKAERERAIANAKLVAANEAEQFESYLRNLLSIHKQCGSSCDWKAIIAAGPPPLPVRADTQEVAARVAMASFRPSLVERMTGAAARRRDELLQAATAGRAADDAAHAEALVRHTADCAAAKESTALAGRVLRRDATAYADALDLAGALDELAAFGSRVRVAASDPDAVVLNCTLDPEIVPQEEVKLSASGKLTTKEMPASRYWTLYQDHVCSASLRLAREAFAVLPISRAVVNIQCSQVNTQTGHDEPVTILAVNYTREVLARLNLDQIDPSDSMSNFTNRMKFKKSAGFTPVDAMTLDENWITT